MKHVERLGPSTVAHSTSQWQNLGPNHRKLLDQFSGHQGSWFSAELRIVPLGSSISLTVRQRGKAIYSVFFLGGSSSVLVVLATILMSGFLYVQFLNSVREAILDFLYK